MKNTAVLFVTALYFSLSSCHRPVAYFQHTAHPAAARLAVDRPATLPAPAVPDSALASEQPIISTAEAAAPAVASRENEFSASVTSRVQQRMHRVQSLLSKSTESLSQQPRPKPKPKGQLRLGNKIRQSLGMPLREELNWWQRISWKLKASVIVLIVAVLFAILHVTILAVIFGIIGALLLISGLKRSFKVRRPWF
ncbi:hypothetical protein [Spirosoma oryzicola]|uniref:hypothetical protein n=1 Tax=Spirosoma oryzicola TaxID=2898794 RepID=UPI001E5170BE|nr:hypothetical protein [Spirosoma oryzicola]UHG92131.1 hypothetical protein LQ777_04305 [Spirosoma oryzicola]